ncbi:glycosyltransferase [Caulobacter sp. S45]|uniref:glycosyltransferase n=1 Tax=Caulobacter sp. S45 TaxID=1641861 RepID=UPI0015768566|nr:glycosyltransferase [Caulobacter sp. S45]
MKRLSTASLAPVRAWRDRRRLLRSGLFDAAWYSSVAPPPPRGRDPAAHYLAVGAAEGRDPHPLFRTAWYVEQNPDVGRQGGDPVLHYLLAGAAEGRDPNPFFSTAWYLAAYPDVGATGSNPLAHYIAHGQEEGRRPSPRFDPAFYLRQLPPDDPGRAAPLTHFLTSGAVRGMKPAPDIQDLAGEPVEWAELRALKAWTGPPGRDTALFVTHAPDGRLKPHVAAHLDALRRAEVEIVLIVAGDSDFLDEAAAGRLAGLYARANLGFDFAAWAHLLKLLPALWDAPGLYLLNDSVIGPVGREAYQAMMGRVRASSADLVGLTESRERGWHLQSYFLCLRAGALRHARVQGFFNAIRSVGDKQAVIDSYEVALAGEAVEAGLKVETLFQKGAEANPTLFAWRSLLADGFPFLKVSVVTERHDTVDSTGWREALQAGGLDAALADPLLAAPLAVPAASAGRTVAAPPSWSPDRIAFYGPWNYANGLGEAGRGYLSAFWRLGSHLNLHGLKTPFHVHQRFMPGYDVRDFVEAADAAIVHLNPDTWHLLTPEQVRAIGRARIRIGLWVWEMDHLPDFFRPNLDKVDVVWTPSRYCADVFAAETRHPVHVVPHVVPVTEDAPQDQPLRRIILYVFDGSSYLVRKNPAALVEAFARSGLAGRGWRLVLKTKNLGDHPGQAHALVERCSEVAGVTLIDRHTSREALAVLMTEADIYASPHVSEGFGLTIAEAMAAGKVVVATDYGGSRDFLDETCGLPVSYDLTTLTQDFGHYRKGGRWAAVRVDALAEALVHGAEGLERGDRTLGAAARARIADRLSAERVAEAMAASFAELATLAPGLEARHRMRRP